MDDDVYPISHKRKEQVPEMARELETAHGFINNSDSIVKQFEVVNNCASHRDFLVTSLSLPNSTIGINLHFAIKIILQLLEGPIGCNGEL